MFHDRQDDCSDVHDPTPEQAEAIALLELNPTGAARPRLTVAQWRHVARVVDALAARDGRTSEAAVPRPRTPDQLTDHSAPSSPRSSR